MFSERLVAPVCGAIIVIAILTPSHLRVAIFLMLLAYYYLTLLSLKEMAHLILWRINRTAFLVCMKEAERVRTRSERLQLLNPENSSGGRLQSSSCCQLRNNSLKTLFDLLQDGSAASSKWRWAKDKHIYLGVHRSKSVKCVANFLWV